MAEVPNKQTEDLILRIESLDTRIAKQTSMFDKYNSSAAQMLNREFVHQRTTPSGKFVDYTYKHLARPTAEYIRNDPVGAGADAATLLALLYSGGAAPAAIQTAKTQGPKMMAKYGKPAWGWTKKQLGKEGAVENHSGKVSLGVGIGGVLYELLFGGNDSIQDVGPPTIEGQLGGPGNFPVSDLTIIELLQEQNMILTEIRDTSCQSNSAGETEQEIKKKAATQEKAADAARKLGANIELLDSKMTQASDGSDLLRVSFDNMLGSLLGTARSSLNIAPEFGPLADFGFSVLGDFFGGLFGGGRADGGAVGPGRAYLVGERGPELLMTGGMSGAVIPNGRFGGGSNTYVNVQTNGQADVQTRESRSANGDRHIDVMIDSMVATSINTPGSKTRRAMEGSFGARPALALR